MYLPELNPGPGVPSLAALVYKKVRIDLTLLHKLFNILEIVLKIKTNPHNLVVLGIFFD